MKQGGAVMTRPCGAVLALAVALAGALPARAELYTKVSDAKAAEVTRYVARQLQEHGLSDPPTVARFAKIDLISQGCPIHLEVTNASRMDLLSVPVTLNSSYSKEKLVADVPLLPARSSTSVFFPCASLSDRGGTYAGVGFGAAVSVESVGKLLTATANTERNSEGFTYRRDAGSESMAQQALDGLAEASDGQELLRLMLKHERGWTELAGFLAGNPRPEQLKPVAAALASVPPAQVSSVLEVLLVAPGTRPSAVSSLMGDMIVRACGTMRAPGPGRARLWKLVSRDASVSLDLKTVVLTSCVPSREALRASADMLGALPSSAAAALQATSDADFQFLVKRFLGTSTGREGLLRFLRSAKERGPFDVVASRLPAEEALAGIVLSREDALAEYKARFVATTLDTLHGSLPPASFQALLKRLLAAALERKVEAAAIRAELGKRVAWLDAEGTAWFKSELEKQSKVVRFEQVTDGNGAKLLDLLFTVPPELEHCTESRAALRKCGEYLTQHPELTRSPLAAPFLAEATRLLTDTHLQDPDIVTITAQYSPWGLSSQAVAEHLCEATLAQHGSRTSRFGLDEALKVVGQVQPDAPCISRVRLRVDWAEAWATAVTVLQALSLLLPFGGLVFLMRRKLRPVQTLIQASTPDFSALSGPGTVEQRLGATAAWEHGLQAALADTRKALREEGSPPAHAAEKAIALAESRGGGTEALAQQARLLAGEATRYGKVQSVLLGGDGALVYLLVVPGRYEQPQTLRRHAGFAEGWLAHVERLTRALPADAAGTPMLALLLFVETDARQVTLLSGLEALVLRLVPGALLDEREAKQVDGQVNAFRGSFSVEAEPVAAPASTGGPAISEGAR